MIIGADCHISSHKFDGLAITADELVEQNVTIAFFKGPNGEIIEFFQTH
jgi:hypothetical protein